jgi:hypothetical protein
MLGSLPISLNFPHYSAMLAIQFYQVNGESKMNETTTNQVAIKIFIGFQYTIDLKMQLKQSKEWKQNSIVQDQSMKRLLEVRYNDMDYIGNYLDFNTLNLKDVRDAAQTIRKELRNYLPELDVEGLNIQLFPQIFVS